MVTARSTHRALTCLLLIALIAAPSQRSLNGEPIGWIERYALAKDRESMLAELIPGSDDYFFYHCLFYQTAGQWDQSEAVLRQWLAAHKGRENSAITAMLDRQRLLTYGESPQRTIDYLVRRLGLQLNHAPPVTKNQRRYPSQLDPRQLDVDVLVKEAVRRNDELKPPGMRYLAELFRANNTAGLRLTLRDFLSRVSGPYIDNLDELVAKEISSRPTNQRRFGDLRAHALLTLDELKNVAARVPEIADDNELVYAMLRRMRPGADSDPSQQLDVRLDYLKRVEAYVQTLPPSYNSLKASAAFRLLEANLSQGEFDRLLFERYLQLPRASQIVHRQFAQRSVKANLNEDFMKVALLPPVGDEQPVVRAHLEHFLRNAENANAFGRYLQPDYLSNVFAETKLLYGVGETDQWYEMLPAQLRQTIRDAVELRLAPTNPKYFSADDPTRLIVDIKNVEELVVRIYEINTSAYYRTHEKPIDTDIDLDGLIATHEARLTYSQPSIQRHRESLELKEIQGRGVWIVDLIGKGVRARALVKRGAIEHVDSASADGMVFTIIDEDRQPIRSAKMWVGSREFAADSQGRIVLPPVVDQVSRRAVISDGEIAAPVEFEHLRERYQLNAGMHLDQTQLQSGGQADLLIRPRLSLGTTVIDPQTLGNVSVRVQAQDLDEIITTHQENDLQVDQNGELVVRVRIPSRLSHLAVTLTGEVVGLADGRTQTLTTTRKWDIAGIRRTPHTLDAFLTRDGKDYVIEVCGRNGELISRAAVSVVLTTELCNSTIAQTFQTDNRGRIGLGSLDGVAQIQFSVPSGLRHQRDLKLDQIRWDDEINTTSDRPIRLPLETPLDDLSSRYRLMELRENEYLADCSDKLSSRDGMLFIQPLAAGDYQLVDRTNDIRTQIAVVDGPAIGLVATGRTRHRSMSPALPLGITSITRDQEGLKIQLSGNTDLARIHVYGSRYLDQTSPINQLYLPFPGLTGRHVKLPACGYVSDLRLGDEYQYVLRRRYAKKYPGVMLPQPGIILNPWETEETTNASQSAREGEALPRMLKERLERETEPSQSKADQEAAAIGSDYDFLADPGVVLTNLRPDNAGVVRIPGDVIDGLPVMQVVACDAVTIVQRTVAAPLPEIETVDLRLAKALDASRALTFERGISIASPDQPLALQSLGSAQLQVYASVADLMKLYRTLVNDPRLDDFGQLAIWHTLDRDAKLDAYSRLASHELHLFLHFHDPTFFGDVVKPYLRNKQEKQFIDHWLLDEELTAYTTLWRYNQLSAAERSLLALRLPDVRESIHREFREIVASQDENHALIRRNIESALRTRGLSLGEDDRYFKQTADLSLQSIADSDGAAFGATLARPELKRRRDLGRKAEEASKDTFEFRAAAPEELNMLRGRQSLGESNIPFFRDLDSTKQWAESQWDRVRTVGEPSPATLINANAFWASLANMDLDSISPSTELLRPVENRHAALVALAVCGLPLSAGNVGLPTDPESVYRPEHAVAVVTKRLSELQRTDNESSILIGQRFESGGNGLSNPSRSKLTLEPNEFLTGESYLGRIVVSNPTAAQRVVDVFWQIPAGTLPLAGSQVTDSRTLTLAPFAVQAIDYQFYFPAPGEFTHYPATVTAEQKLIAQAEQRQFTVVTEPTEQTAISWEKVARTGTAEEIEAFLRDANLRELDWMLVAHRMQDQDVYRVVIDRLGQSQLPIKELWAYSFAHRDDEAIRSYLSVRDDLIARVGPVLNSPLLRVEPIERRMHELLEYAPLVRARIHPLGQQDEILNPSLAAQYQRFLRSLTFAPEISLPDRLVLSYYLLIQNRIAAAIENFSEIDRAQIDSQLQYDYMDAYLAMHKASFDRAETIASRYSEHSIPRWNQRFSALRSQLIQRRDLNQSQTLVSVDRQNDGQPIAEDSGDLSLMDRERRQQHASEQQPEVMVRVEGDALRIDHRKAKDVTLNLYGVDLELLFSKAPFVREDLTRMAIVQPSRTESIGFDAATGVGRFDLDENLRRQTLLVEVVAGASRSTALYYGGDITTYVSESFGQLQTTDARTNRPISTAYVKVYGKYPDGSVKFYKDGYTDARGRFDYASVSASDAKGALRYAILVLSDEQGATLHDAAAPNR